MKTSISLYENAPDMLLDSIAEVNAMLEKSKAKSGESASFKFWKRVSDVMKFSWDYMQSTKFIHDKNIMLSQENNFLRKYSADLESKLNAYEVIRELKINGSFEESVDRVNRFMNDEENMKLFALKKELEHAK